MSVFISGKLILQQEISFLFRQNVCLKNCFVFKSLRKRIAGRLKEDKVDLICHHLHLYLCIFVLAQGIQIPQNVYRFVYRQHGGYVPWAKTASAHDQTISAR